MKKGANPRSGRLENNEATQEGHDGNELIRAATLGMKFDGLTQSDDPKRKIR